MLSLIDCVQRSFKSMTDTFLYLTFIYDTIDHLGLVPLFGIDVWEHAYYLDYKNVRPDYVKQIWKITNWTDVAERLKEAQK